MFWKSVEQTTFLCGFCQHLIASVKGNITVFKALQPSYTVIPEKKSVCQNQVYWKDISALLCLLTFSIVTFIRHVCRNSEIALSCLNTLLAHLYINKSWNFRTIFISDNQKVNFVFFSYIKIYSFTSSVVVTVKDTCTLKCLFHNLNRPFPLVTVASNPTVLRLWNTWHFDGCITKLYSILQIVIYLSRLHIFDVDRRTFGQTNRQASNEANGDSQCESSILGLYFAMCLK